MLSPMKFATRAAVMAVCACAALVRIVAVLPVRADVALATAQPATEIYGWVSARSNIRCVREQPET